jgi:hypothetical protein
VRVNAFTAAADPPRSVLALGAWLAFCRTMRIAEAKLNFDRRTSAFASGALQAGTAASQQVCDQPGSKEMGRKSRENRFPKTASGPESSSSFSLTRQAQTNHYDRRATICTAPPQRPILYYKIRAL